MLYQNRIQLAQSSAYFHLAYTGSAGQPWNRQRFHCQKPPYKSIWKFRSTEALIIRTAWFIKV